MNANFIGISYSDPIKARRALWWLHQRGFEGEPEGTSWLTEGSKKTRLFGFRILIPEGWQELPFLDQRMKTLFDEMDAFLARK
jgi:hypothetical protein